MKTTSHMENLTPALENYLETLWEILQFKKVAQISDIAERRGVNVASVTPAMRRLMKMGLVDYTARAWVDLTAEGIKIARKVKARHDLIKRFLMEVLGVSEKNAAKDACSAEHMFSDETIDRLVRFFEYTRRCDATEMSFLKRFLTCSVVHPEKEQDKMCTCTPQDRKKKQKSLPQVRCLSNLCPAETATILQVVSKASMRQALIDRGMISGREIQVVRIDSDGELVWVRMGPDKIALSIQEAESILVSE